MEVTQSATKVPFSLEPLNHRLVGNRTYMETAIGMLYWLISHHSLIQSCSFRFGAIADLIGSQAHRH